MRESRLFFMAAKKRPSGKEPWKKHVKTEEGIQKIRQCDIGTAKIIPKYAEHIFCECCRTIQKHMENDENAYVTPHATTTSREAFFRFEEGGRVFLSFR